MIEDVCDYFNHKLTFLPWTKIKIYLSLGRRSTTNINSHIFMSFKLQVWLTRVIN